MSRGCCWIVAPIRDVWDWWGRTALYIAIDRKETLRRGSWRQRGQTPARLQPRPPVSSMDIINALLAADVDDQCATQYASPEPQGK